MGKFLIFRKISTTSGLWFAWATTLNLWTWKPFKLDMIGLDVDRIDWNWLPIFLSKSINGYLFVAWISTYASTYVHVMNFLSSTMPSKCNLKAHVYTCLNEWMLKLPTILCFLSSYAKFVFVDFNYNSDTYGENWVLFILSTLLIIQP